MMINLFFVILVSVSIFIYMMQIQKDKEAAAEKKYQNDMKSRGLSIDVERILNPPKDDVRNIEIDPKNLTMVTFAVEKNFEFGLMRDYRILDERLEDSLKQIYPSLKKKKVVKSKKKLVVSKRTKAKNKVSKRKKK